MNLLQSPTMSEEKQLWVSNQYERKERPEEKMTAERLMDMLGAAPAEHEKYITLVKKVNDNHIAYALRELEKGPENFKNLRAVAFELYIAGLYQETLPFLHKAEVKNPNDWGMLSCFSATYLKLGNGELSLLYAHAALEALNKQSPVDYESKEAIEDIIREIDPFWDPYSA